MCEAAQGPGDERRSLGETLGVQPMAFRREFKVGIFMLASFCVIGLVVFMIGEERRAFSTKAEYFSVFPDVQGLRRGSPVRMGGVDIGAVSDVSYATDVKDAKIYVRMSIVSTEARRIRQDSVAAIEGKGLLGDKMVSITVGSVQLPEVPPGAQVPAKTSDDMAQMIARLGTVSAQAEKVMGNLERTTQSLSDPELHDGLKASMLSVSHILGSVERREGYVGKLFSDPAEAERLSRVVGNLERVSGELEQTLRGINRVIARVEQGPGLAHEVIYGQQGSQVLSQFGGAAEELSTTLKGVREGNGLARGLLFGGSDSDKLSADLEHMSGDLRQIVGDLKAGRGTLGALLVDPSVYEDLKLVLGNVERNKALRALVRYSIRKDEGAPKVRDPDGPAVSTPASATGGASIGGPISSGTAPTSGE